MNVKGLKVKDILNIDLDAFNNLNESQLRALTSRLVSASNKRIRRLKECDIYSPAIRGLGDIEQFSTKLNEDVTPEQRVNQLRSRFAKIRNFMTSETSTISGFNKFVKRIKTKLAKDLGMTYKDVDTGGRQRDSAIHIHASILPQTPLPSRLSQTWSRIPCAVQ